MNYGKPQEGKLYTTRSGECIGLVTENVQDFKLFYSVLGKLINLKTGESINYSWTRKGYSSSNIEEYASDLMELYGDKKTHPEYYL